MKHLSDAPPHAPADMNASGELSRRRLMRQGLACALPGSWLLAGCVPDNSAISAPTSAPPPAPLAPARPAAPRWATGGTARMGAAVRASEPFAGATATTCELSCEATIGPCHTLSPERSDISDGWDGLPMHMQLRIVDAQCAPVVGAIVEIWHTNHTGGYSGRIVQMCNNNAADMQRQFFRGWQRTDKEGIVRFDSCYPGWYSSRANHVHLRVMKGDYDPSDSAPAWITTQLLFADEINAEIFGSAALYKDKGQPDTTLNTDNVVGQTPDKSPYLFDVRNVDGVMLASKTLALRSSLDERICMAQGTRPAGGPGGPGGPPPGAPAGPGAMGMPPRGPHGSGPPPAGHDGSRGNH